MADDLTDTPTSVTTETMANDAPEAVVANEAPNAAADASADTPADPDETILGGKVADAEAEEPAAEAPAGAPEKYELALEGMDLDSELLGEAEPVLRELNLTNDQANTLLPVAAKLIEKTRDGALQQITAAAAEQRADWAAIAKADPEIGGAKWDETVHLSAKGLEALGFKEGHPFRAALTETGFGNHRDMIAAFRKVGEMVGEDGEFARSDAGAAVVSAKDVLYGNSK